MTGKKRILALALCIGLLVVLFTSSAYIVHEADHDCVGEGCEICEIIGQARALLHGLALLGAVLLAVSALLAVHRARCGMDGIRLFARRTLVSWKIRLNN